MTSRSSFGPRLRLEDFLDLGFWAMMFYHLIRLTVGWSPRRGLDPDARNGHAVANRACLPIPALGHMVDSSGIEPAGRVLRTLSSKPAEPI